MTFYTQKRSYSSFENNTRPTDGHDLLQRCVVASKTIAACWILIARMGYDTTLGRHMGQGLANIVLQFQLAEVMVNIEEVAVDDE